MFIVVLNQNNITQDGLNSELVYKFPNSITFKDKYIAVSSISMFYSWFNITDTAQNNTLSYTWTSGTTTTTYTVVIPNGMYNIVDINAFLQFTFIKNNTYWTIGGSNYYPLELIVNPSRYAIQINTYLIPSSLPSGATVPTGFPGWPTSPQNSVLIIPQYFNKIIGYPINFTTNSNLNNSFVPPNPSTVVENFVSKNASGTLSYLSSQSPQVQPNNNILFSLSNINNPYSVPSSIIYSLSPTVEIGQQINERPPNFMWNRMIDGTYNELRLQLRGNDFQRLKINDPNMTILLTIRDKFDVQSN
jgi:hypothetical protein